LIISDFLQVSVKNFCCFNKAKTFLFRFSSFYFFLIRLYRAVRLFNVNNFSFFNLLRGVFV